MLRRSLRFVLAGLVVLGISYPYLNAACCYFSAKNTDVLQPSQKVFITWDPVKKVETFTVQPKFEGNALDFGMVIPTPSQPKLHEMPRDFFRSIAVYTILGRREVPYSNLMFQGFGGIGGLGGGLGGLGGGFAGMVGAIPAPPPRKPAVKVLETGVVGSLDYKIIKAERADDLFKWLKDHKYQYSGDEATLQHYIQKKWFFTVMKIDTIQMKKNKDGTFAGEVTPTRFQFNSDECVYPLKITQLSVKDKTEALFYVQAPMKMDLAGEMSYQPYWAQMLEAARGCSSGPLPGNGDQWLKAIAKDLPDLAKRGKDMGFTFVSGQRPAPNEQGRTPTTVEWAKRLTPQDIAVLARQLPFSEIVPNPDVGFTIQDMMNPRRAEAVRRIIQQRLDQYKKARPNGYLVREAPAEEIRQLQLLLGHLQSGLFVIKFRKVFTRGEMNDDLVLVPSRHGDAEDASEYWEMLPTSPP